MSQFVEANVQSSKRAGLPRWPRWSNVQGRKIIVSGRHLTPARARMCQILSGYTTSGILIFFLVYCWHFQNIPHCVHDFVSSFVQGTRHAVTEERLNWIYFCLWLSACLLSRRWRESVYWLFALVFSRRTTVTFTPNEVRLHRFCCLSLDFRRDEGAEMAFVITEHPRLPWLQLKAGQNTKLAEFHRQSRFIFFQYGGGDLIPITGFIDPAAAEQFLSVCQMAMSHRFYPQASSLVPTTTGIASRERKVAHV